MTATPKKKHRMRKAMLCILLVLVVGLAGLYGFTMLRAKYTVVYQGYTARAGSLTDEMSFDSTISLIDSQTAAASAAGKVRKVVKAPGETVKKGDTILILENGERVKATVDGKVNTVPFEAGRQFAAGDTLATVADFTHVKVVFNANEYNVGKLYRGKPCTVKVTAGGQSYDAVLDSISHEGSISRNVANYSCTVYLNVDGDVHPGMKVKVSFSETLAEEAVIVSRSALSFDASNQAFVYLQDDEGKMVRHPVTLGGLNDNDAQVLTGLKSGDVFYARVKISSPMDMMMQMMRQSQQTSGYGNGYGGGTNNRRNGGSGSWGGGNR